MEARLVVVNLDGYPNNSGTRTSLARLRRIKQCAASLALLYYSYNLLNHSSFTS